MINSVDFSSCKATFIHVIFNDTWIFSADYKKNTQIPNFMKIPPMVFELFYAGWQADEANSRFSHICD